jgi:hypothetical protein
MVLYSYNTTGTNNKHFGQNAGCLAFKPEHNINNTAIGRPSTLTDESFIL